MKEEEATPDILKAKKARKSQLVQGDTTANTDAQRLVSQATTVSSTSKRTKHQRSKTDINLASLAQKNASALAADSAADNRAVDKLSESDSKPELVPTSLENNYFIRVDRERQRRIKEGLEEAGC